MAKFYVIVNVQSKSYRLCKDDVKTYHHVKVKKNHSIPPFYFKETVKENNCVNTQEDDEQPHFQSIKVN